MGPSPQPASQNSDGISIRTAGFVLLLILVSGLSVGIVRQMWRVSEYEECRLMCGENRVKLFRGKMDREYAEATPPECECFVPGTGGSGSAQQDGGVPANTAAATP